MRRSERGLAGAVLLLVAGCAAKPPAPAELALPTVAGPQCRVDGEGGPPATRVAERGIGGTGIIGVVTGFASICLAGQEVGYDPAVPVAVDGVPAAAGALRAGQLAAVQANGPAEALVARQISVRHEVSGPVESVGSGLVGGPLEMRVAGQPVVVRAATLGVTRGLQPGDWVAVSGFRDGDGVIQATRVDRRAPGAVVVHGIPVPEGADWRVGSLPVRFAPGLRPLPGVPAVLRGQYMDGVLYSDAVLPDVPLEGGGPGLFGEEFVGFTGVFVVESYAGFSDGLLVLNRTRQGGGGPVQRSMVELARGTDGTMRSMARALGAGGPGDGPRGGGGRAGGRPAEGGGARLEPAPVPGRGSEPRSGGPGRDGEGRGRGGAERGGTGGGGFGGTGASGGTGGVGGGGGSQGSGGGGFPGGGDTGDGGGRRGR